MTESENTKKKNDICELIVKLHLMPSNYEMAKITDVKYVICSVHIQIEC